MSLENNLRFDAFEYAQFTQSLLFENVYANQVKCAKLNRRRNTEDEKKKLAEQRNNGVEGGLIYT